MRRWILRPLAWLLAIGAVIGAVLAGAIRLDQYVLQRRGERLLSDIRSLELRKSTLADVQRLEDRWIKDTKEGLCQPYWCDLQIFLGNTSRRHLDFLINHPALFAIYHGLGGRVAGVGSSVRIRDNLLWGKSIGLAIETLSTESDGRNVEYDLEGSIGTDDHLTWVSAQHPEYQIGGSNICTGCRLSWVKFTPFADPQDVLRLTDLNFGCLTRWHPCKEQADILPTAWKQLRAEAAEGALQQSRLCTPITIRILSRQAHCVDLAKIIKLENEGAVPLMTLRRLPESVPQCAKQWQEFPLPVDPSDGFHLGDKLLVLDGDTCRAVPATAENLGAAQLGAGEGWISPADPVGLPFGTLKPPKIDVH